MKKHLNVSNILYGTSIIFALGVLLKVYIDRSRLPAGVCPVDNSSGLMYFAIGLLIVTTVVTSVLDWRKKRSDKENSDDR